MQSGISVLCSILFGVSLLASYLFKLSFVLVTLWSLPWSSIKWPNAFNKAAGTEIYHYRKHNKAHIAVWCSCDCTRVSNKTLPVFLTAVGFHDAVPRDRLPLPPREKLCSDVKRPEDQQMLQVEWAPCQVSSLRLCWTRAPSGVQLRWWRWLRAVVLSSSRMLIF